MAADWTTYLALSLLGAAQPAHRAAGPGRAAWAGLGQSGQQRVVCVVVVRCYFETLLNTENRFPDPPCHEHHSGHTTYMLPIISTVSMDNTFVMYLYTYILCGSFGCELCIFFFANVSITLTHNYDIIYSTQIVELWQLQQLSVLRKESNIKTFRHRHDES